MCARGLLPLGSCFLFLLHASSRTRAPSLLSGSGFLFLLTMHPSDSRQRMPKPKDPALGHELPLASPIQFVSHAWPIMRLAPAPFAQLLAPPVSTPPTLSNSGSPATVWQLLPLPVHASKTNHIWDTANVTNWPGSVSLPPPATQVMLAQKMSRTCRACFARAASSS